jgi:phage gp36-like protein
MYCEKQDVINDFKSLTVSDTSIITNHKLDDIIEEESNYIDSYISQRYVIPITSPKARNILKRICVFRVSERIKNIIEVKSNATQVNSEEKNSNTYVRTPNHDLVDIAKGKMLLIGATLKSNDLGVKSFTSKKSGTCAFFDVNKQQW